MCMVVPLVIASECPLTRLCNIHASPVMLSRHGFARVGIVLDKNLVHAWIFARRLKQVWREYSLATFYFAYECVVFILVSMPKPWMK